MGQERLEVLSGHDLVLLVLVDEDEEVADAFSSQFTDSDSVIKNTLETFFAVKLENISFLRSFQQNLHSLTLMGYGEIDISPIGSL